MTTTTLKNEVQIRIDALAYPIDATELLQNAVDTVGLELDLTNIVSVLNSSTSAITGATPDDDITALNATSIALGVTTKEQSSTSAKFTVSAALANQLTVGEKVMFDRETKNILPKAIIDNAPYEMPYVSVNTTVGYTHSIFMGDEDRYMVTFYNTIQNTSTTLSLRVFIVDTWTGETESKTLNWTGADSDSTVNFVGTPSVNPLNNTKAFFIFATNQPNNTDMVYIDFALNITDISLSTVNGRTTGDVTYTSERIENTSTYARYNTTTWCWLNDGNIMIHYGTSSTQSNLQLLDLSDYSQTIIGSNLTIDVETRSAFGGTCLIQTAGGNLVAIDVLGKLHLIEYSGGVVTLQAQSPNALSGFSSTYPISIYQNPTDPTEIVTITYDGTTMYVSTQTIDETSWSVSDDTNLYNVVVEMAQYTYTAVTNSNILIYSNNAGVVYGTALFDIGSNGRPEYPLITPKSQSDAFLPTLNGLGTSFVASSATVGTTSGLGKASFGTIATVKNILSNEVVDVSHVIGVVNSIDSGVVTVDTSLYGALTSSGTLNLGDMVDQGVAITNQLLFSPKTEFKNCAWGTNMITPSSYTSPYYEAIKTAPNNFNITGQYTRVSFSLNKKCKIFYGSIENGDNAGVDGLLVADGIVYQRAIENAQDHQINVIDCNTNFHNYLSTTCTTPSPNETRFTFEEY